ncbi:MAG: hypothetical protein HN704_10460 [Bacteroidetes bacterium]|jgi:hypothetical protein|nr:hypothetical protein [Bacteroidota bacterium]MBT7492014.1 hypothetical protein [Bacteroidota bacterium]
MNKFLISLVLIINTFLSFGYNANLGAKNDSYFSNSESKIDSMLNLAAYSHYLYLYSLSNGDYWRDETTNNSYFYRLLFSSVGEEAYIDVEKIEILEEGKLKLVSRIKLQPEIFNLEYFPLRPNLIIWKSPIEVVVKINMNHYLLDLRNTSAKIIE